MVGHQPRLPEPPLIIATRKRGSEMSSIIIVDITVKGNSSELKQKWLFLPGIYNTKVLYLLYCIVFCQRIETSLTVKDE